MNNWKTIPGSLLMLLLLVACGGHDHGDEGHAHGTEEHADSPKGIVSLTEAQMQAVGIVVGTFDSIAIADEVRCNGMIDLPPTHRASMNSPMNAFVRNCSHYLEGDFVPKGTLLAELEHPDLLILQQEYLESKSQCDFLEKDYKRQQTLSAAQVSSKKKMEKVQAEWEACKAKTQGLGQRLSYLGLSPEKAAAGKFSQRIPLRAPISGYIAHLGLHEGKFVSPEDEIYRIVNTEHVHLELEVFEKDIFKIRKNQTIRFETPGAGPGTYTAEVHLVGRDLDPETRTIKVHGHLTGEHPDFFPGIYVEAHILQSDQKVLSLPRTGLILDDDREYIFLQKGALGTFERLEVGTGIRNDKFVEILAFSELEKGRKVVTEGAYYLQSEIKKTEESAHSH